MQCENNNLFINVADFYDLDPRNIVKNDIPFYLEYAKKTKHKTVLELGCGTGRVSIPLAKAGCDITGLDLSNSMLSVFKRKLDADSALKKNITLVNADMSSFSLGKSFDLIIIPFRAFQVLTTDETSLSCLKCIRNHLSHTGIFIIDIFEPNKKLDKSWIYEERVQWESVDPKTGETIIKFDEGYDIDVDSQIIYVKQTYKLGNSNLEFSCFFDYLMLRFYYYEQIITLIKKAGLKVESEYKFYDKSPINGGREIILVCS